MYTPPSLASKTPFVSSIDEPMLPKASRQSPKPSDAAFGEALHIQRAVSHVLGQAEITDLLSGKCRPSPTEFRVLIARALQAYSAEHGVLNLVNKMRECIGDTRRSEFSIDGVPVSRLICRVHCPLEYNDAPPEYSGASEIASHELGRIVLSRRVSGRRDAAHRKTHVIELRCELAPNLYGSPISALMLGLAQDVFLYPKVLDMLNSKVSHAERECFYVDGVSCLGVPHKGDLFMQAFQATEMKVFEQLLGEAYRFCFKHGTAEQLLSEPVASLMRFKALRMRHDAPLGPALLKYLNHQADNHDDRYDIAELMDVFQSQIRACPLASAPPSAIGRAYFNTQLRNLLCLAQKQGATPEDMAAFELKIRAYRELRTQGMVDAPVNTALVGKVWSVAPEHGKDNARQILSSSSSSEAMVFEIDGLH